MNKSPLRKRCIEFSWIPCWSIRKNFQHIFWWYTRTFPLRRKMGRKESLDKYANHLPFLCVPKRNQFHSFFLILHTGKLGSKIPFQPSKREFNEATLLMKTLLLPSSSQVIESWNAFFKWTNFQKLTLVEKFLISVGYFKLLTNFGILQVHILCFSLWVK